MKYASLYGYMLSMNVRSLRALSDLAGINYQVVLDKFNGKKEWRRDEIFRICNVLNISNPNEVVEFFFPEILQKCI